MARTGQNITLRKDGRWEGRYIKGYQDGKAVYAYVYARSFEEACQKKAEAQREHSACKNNFNNCIFSDLTESFLKQKKYQVLLKQLRRQKFQEVLFISIKIL